MSSDFEGRLLEEGDDLERSLLASAKSDAPSPTARKRTLLALGLGGSLVTATSATAASTAGFAIVKWIGIAALGSAVVAGGAYQATSPSQASAPPPPAAKGQQARVAKVIGVTIRESPAKDARPSGETSAAPEAQAKLEPPSPVEESAAVPSEPEPAAPKKVAAAPAAETKSPVSLGDEVASLDEARQAVERGDSAKAMAALESHEKKFGKTGGMLGPEVMVVRIEALASKGDRAGAAAAANEFLARHPNSPHASRVRSILAAQTSAP